MHHIAFMCTTVSEYADTTDFPKECYSSPQIIPNYKRKLPLFYKQPHLILKLMSYVLHNFSDGDALSRSHHLRSDWNPSLDDSKTHVCFTALHCFLVFFCLLPALVGENTLSKYWLKWGKFWILQKCLVTHSSDFSCHVSVSIYIFLFSFIFLVFLVYAAIWISTRL